MLAPSLASAPLCGNGGLDYGEAALLFTLLLCLAEPSLTPLFDHSPRPNGGFVYGEAALPFVLRSPL